MTILHWLDNISSTTFTPRDYLVELIAAAFEKNIIISLGHNSTKEFITLKLILEKSYELRNERNPKKTTLFITSTEAGGESIYNLIYHLTNLSVMRGNIDAIDEANIALGIDSSIDEHAGTSSDIIIDENYETNTYGKTDTIASAASGTKSDESIESTTFTIADSNTSTDTSTRNSTKSSDGASSNTTGNANAKPSTKWANKIHDFQVVILNIGNCRTALKKKLLRLSDINMIIVEDCHKQLNNAEFIDFFKRVAKKKQPPKVLGLGGPIHSAECPTEELEFHLGVLEKQVRCKVEASSDIVTVLRYCTKPTELFVQCMPYNISSDTTTFLIDFIQTKKSFLKDHRHDLEEIYGDLYDPKEWEDRPDPTILPLKYLDQYLEVLNDLGVWCADQAAYHIIDTIETKDRHEEPYERQCLLLLFTLTAFVQIRAYCMDKFEEKYSKLECLEEYSSPKAKRLFEILRQYKPDKPMNSTPIGSPIKSKKIENGPGILLNSIEQKTEVSPAQNAEPNADAADISKVEAPSTLKIATASTSKTDAKTRSRKSKYTLNRHQRQMNPNFGNDANALCGLIFCNAPYTARVLFRFVSEMVKSDKDFEFISVQYIVDKEADPEKDPPKYEREHHTQEEVLRRFRIHTCNLLIGTTFLEEGIELPKCNLVVRWDLPATYRSYALCKGKARIPRAYHIIMVNAPLNIVDRNQEFLSVTGHRSFCLQDGSHHTCHNLNALSERLEKVNPELNEPNIYYSMYSAQLKSMDDKMESMLKLAAEYMEIEKILLKNCSNHEPNMKDSTEADLYTHYIQPYVPTNATDPTITVSLANSVVLVNKYCSKLPSDTFTKLTPLWRCLKTERNGRLFYQYTVRLPINSPVKQDIYGLPMPSRELARRFAALICCKVLHESGELDEYLQPIGKEAFRASEPEYNNFELSKEDAEIIYSDTEARPGTTRRRQYYFKRIASVFSDCRPVINEPCYLYFIKMVLECPIPEEQNTRGREIYAPEDSAQGFGILTSKPIPKLGSFSIFTRSGEVRVSLELATANVTFDQQKLDTINTFLQYLFGNVLRLQKYLMFFDATASENSYFVVPTKRRGRQNAVDVDWSFMDVIASKSNQKLLEVEKDIRRTQNFDRDQFHDAVVMPWYRNRNQPQYFYVAEICDYLSPQSSFPGDSYATFKEYYLEKYQIDIQNVSQPLLDVDHTSARLNFLTPRYVNRKGVALPTSSEETKRAKRENLEQKQILVPELCAIHPFSASLWRIAVCLPCVLYRFNALLLADEIRIEVSKEIQLGTCDMYDKSFDWPILDFGWNLADVLKKAKDKKNKTAEAIESAAKKIAEDKENKIKAEKLAAGGTEHDEEQKEKLENGDGDKNVEQKEAVDKENEIGADIENKENDFMMDIGVWDNEMAKDIKIEEDVVNDDDESEFAQWKDMLPGNITMCSTSGLNARVASPTFATANASGTMKSSPSQFYLGAGSDASYDSDILDTDDEYEEPNDGLQIEFKTDNTAEAIETEEEKERNRRKQEIIETINANERSYQDTKNVSIGYNSSLEEADMKTHQLLEKRQFECRLSIEQFENRIRESDAIVSYGDPVNIVFTKSLNTSANDTHSEYGFAHVLFSFLPEKVLQQFIASNGCLNASGEYQFTLDNVYELHQIYSETTPTESYSVDGVGSLFDSFNDDDHLSTNDDGTHLLQLNSNKLYTNRPIVRQRITEGTDITAIPSPQPTSNKPFSFDYQPNLINHPGPSPSVVLQALTMSNANDGINLERLETIGDSFLKYAITTYLYCTYENVHEGKLSHLRSRQVSNLNLYRLGKAKGLGERMIATKFEPHDNWLPPCYFIPKDLEKALIEAKIPAYYWELARFLDVKALTVEEICEMVKERMIRIERMKLSKCVNDEDESDVDVDAENIEEGGLDGEEGNVENAADGNDNEADVLNGCSVKGADENVADATSGIEIEDSNENGVNKNEVDNDKVDVSDKNGVLAKHEAEVLIQTRIEDTNGNQAATKGKAEDDVNDTKLARESEAEASNENAGPVENEAKVSDENEANGKEVEVVDENKADASNEARIEDANGAEAASDNEADVVDGIDVVDGFEGKIVDENEADDKGEFSVENSAEVAHRNEFELENDIEMDNGNDSTPDDQILLKMVQEKYPCFIPYNLVTQHSIPDKSIADCVEALIGANLIECGPRGALIFMSWLGIRVLPSKEVPFLNETPPRLGSSPPFERDGRLYQTIYDYWAPPKSPLVHHTPNALFRLNWALDGYRQFEDHIGYHFNDRSYLLQALTHASYSQNRLTDCYQRLEFLGDAVLDYLITRHLYEDPRQHTPGALTDLRSALVNNTIFASLAVRHGFHKYFRHLSAGLNDVIERFVRIQEENKHVISEEFYLISQDDCAEAEDVEVPKALGDIFESVAGAIYLDSNMSLDSVWEVYRKMMQPEIDQFSESVPKSPIRELLELEPEKAKFEKPEKLADGRRVRVSVNVIGHGVYRGIGRNYRIAKCTAAKCALRQIKLRKMNEKRKRAN